MVVGTCASGKTTIVRELKARGFEAATCSQEHTTNPYLWRRKEPRFLVVLQCKEATVQKRRGRVFPKGLHKKQVQRLGKARKHCHLFLPTDDLTISDAVEKIVESFTKEMGGGNVKAITLKEIKENPRVKVYLQRADDYLGKLGFTEHGFRHAELVARIARSILQQLEYPEHMQELAAIAGYLHDIGNMINRNNHDALSALLTETVLWDMGMNCEDIACIIGAIGNHDEEGGFPTTPVASALIIADKSDVHRSRVREKDRAAFDIHDRVNFAAKKSSVLVNKESMEITLDLEIDTELVSVMDYFEIFLIRMTMCRRAAQALQCNFHLHINGNRLL